MKGADAVFFFCVLATSASCAGKSAGGDDDSVPAVPMPAPPPNDDETLPGAAGPPMLEESGETGSVEDLVLSILDESCGACHGRGSSTAPDMAPGPLEFTYDIDRMVALGIIDPFKGIFSQLVRVMQDGSMPPPGVEPRPTESEIEAVRYFIDHPLNWPDEPPRYAK